MSEQDTVGIRQIIRLRLANGADISTISPKSRRFPYDGWWQGIKNEHLDFALAKRCESMVDELLQAIDKIELNEIGNAEGKPKGRGRASHGTYLERYVSMRSRQSHEPLNDLVEIGQPNLEIFKLLLQSDDERGILKLRDLGADLLDPTSRESPLKVATEWGYAELWQR